MSGRICPVFNKPASKVDHVVVRNSNRCLKQLYRILVTDRLNISNITPSIMISQMDPRFIFVATFSVLYFFLTGYQI